MVWWAGEGGKLSADDTVLNLPQEVTVTWAAAAGMQLRAACSATTHTSVCAQHR